MTTNNPTDGTLQASLLVSAERWGSGSPSASRSRLLLAVVSGLSRSASTPSTGAQRRRSVPLLGLLPLFIVWFGIDDLPKILIVVLGALFPMYVNMFAGIRGVDPRLGELARCSACPAGVVRHVVLPGSLPSALTGLRLSVVGSLLALVVGDRSSPTPGSA